VFIESTEILIYDTSHVNDILKLFREKYFDHSQNTRLFQVKNNSVTISKMKNEKRESDEDTSFMMNVKQLKNAMK